MAEEAPTVAEQSQEPKKSHARRRDNQSQVPESNAPLRTRGALRKRLKQYDYGIYTYERFGTIILNLRRSLEVLISQGPTQESTAALTKKKILLAPTRKKSKKNPVVSPSESVQPTTVAAPSESVQPRTIATPSKSTHLKTVEKEVSSS